MINTGDLQNAIYKLYPQVAVIRGDEAYDADGNVVAYDLALVTAQAQKDACKDKAKSLLAQTDWAVLSDVGLKNSADFVTYRGILRGLVIQPQETPDFPVEPKAIWS
jgi:hypothetical protein